MNPSGTSLLVPSVQELAKQNLSTVPPRYVQPQLEDKILISQEAHSTHLIPVIDLHNLLYAQSGTSELDKLHLACKDWGFFQLVNHGVSPSLVEKVKLEIKDFFNLPMSEKKKFWQTPQHMEGFGQAFVMSEDQRLDWADLYYMTTLPEHSRMPHLFPKLPLPFRDTLEVYSQEMKDLALVIIGHMGKALKIEEKEIRELFEDGIQLMRMNYYPPCPEPEKVIGLTPHSDGIGLTILLQVNEVEGLQIRKDGLWVPVKPLPNAFIVNVGDILENPTTSEINHTVRASKPAPWTRNPHPNPMHPPSVIRVVLNAFHQSVLNCIRGEGLVVEIGNKGKGVKGGNELGPMRKKLSLES
ncbi:unnamed protein product [Sphenostylis stenocarpa]|uniref:Fe2OG dioxygenase domain-containing protein n=1 Tax=Sphenostylis stenocarpa TaxID=92480 RepID=A0AA86T0H3_9FABA|nr:unnamed protein product [Sphenostylis stenocarpa]